MTEVKIHKASILATTFKTLS